MPGSVHIRSRLLCLLLVFALLPVTGASAAEDNPFVLPEPMPEMTFVDVSPSAWYYKNVADVCALGLMEGCDETHFKPNGQVLLSQAVTVAVRVYEIWYRLEVDALDCADPWYAPYVERAKSYGILPEALLEADMNRAATRAELAAILAGVLPKEELTPINQVEDIADYSKTEPYWDAVVTLYRAGVLTGDTSGRFRPDQSIRRSELAAVLSRLTLPENRIRMEDSGLPSGMGVFALPDPLPELPFDDVKPGQWYYANIQRAYAMGLVSGVDSRNFEPNGTVRLSQAVTVAVRIYEKYHGLPDLSGDYGGPWYSYYMDRAVDYGILPQYLQLAPPDQLVTRAELSAVLCGGLPLPELPAVKEVTALPDYGPSDPYWPQIQALYQAGVLTGQDAAGTFNPGSLVRRSELASLLTRLVLPQERRETALAKKALDMETILYGTSSLGRDLTAYRFGSGQNVLVVTFAMHGWEDRFPRDGQLLVDTAYALRTELTLRFKELITAGDWTVYILPCLNPDGLYEGWTHNGPGRCTIQSMTEDGSRREKRIDLNRSFPHKFSRAYSDRNYNGTAPLQATEARALAEFTQKVRGQGRNVLIDVHGWYQQTIVESGSGVPIYQAFCQHFPQNVRSYFVTASGYYSAWAGYELGYNACLFEFPYISDAAAFHDNGYRSKFVNSIAELLRTLPNFQENKLPKKQFLLQ